MLNTLFDRLNLLSKPFFFCEWQVYENMEVKKRVALSNPYGNWIKENLRSLKSENFLSSSVMENDAVLRHQQWEFYVDFALGLYPWRGNFCFKVFAFLNPIDLIALLTVIV